MNMSTDFYACSIVIPVRNGEAYISDCIESILKQDFHSPYEIIIIDDNSTDRTSEIIRKFTSKHQNIRYLYTSSSGIASALNEGILAAKSKIILRMDADDLMMPNRLSIQLAYLADNPDCVLLGGQIKVFGNSQSLPIPNKYPSSHSDIIRMLSKGNAFAHPTVAFRKDAAVSVGLYDSKFDGAEDYELWTRLVHKGTFHNLTYALVNYRIHEHQVTKEKIRKVQRKTYVTQLRWVFLSLPRYWNLPLHKVIAYKIIGAIFLFSRICRDLFIRLRNAY